MTPQETQRRIDEGMKCLRELREHWKSIAAPIRILVADDDSAFCQLLSDMLEEILGRRCVMYQTNSGRNAIEVISQHELDLLFLDLRMPHGSGIDVIKSLPSHHSMVILCVTGLPDESSEISEALALGYSVIRKSDLLADLRSVFGANCSDCRRMPTTKLGGINCDDCPKP